MKYIYNFIEPQKLVMYYQIVDVMIIIYKISNMK
jgi:hypothetical protein